MKAAGEHKAAARAVPSSPAAFAVQSAEIGAAASWASSLPYPSTAVAEQFRRQSAARWPAAPQRLLIQCHERGAGGRERALDTAGEVTDDAIIENKLAIGGEFHHDAAQHGVVGRLQLSGRHRPQPGNHV